MKIVYSSGRGLQTQPHLTICILDKRLQCNCAKKVDSFKRSGCNLGVEGVCLLLPRSVDTNWRTSRTSSCSWRLRLEKGSCSARCVCESWHLYIQMKITSWKAWRLSYDLNWERIPPYPDLKLMWSFPNLRGVGTPVGNWGVTNPSRSKKFFAKMVNAWRDCKIHRKRSKSATVPSTYSWF